MFGGNEDEIISIIVDYYHNCWFFNGPNPALSVYFRPFLNAITNMEKAYIVCLGFEPGTTGWPVSYGAHQKQLLKLVLM